MIRTREISLRRAMGFGCVGLLLALDVYATGLLGGSERTLGVVRSIILPGLPFLEWIPVLGILTIAAAIAAVGAWLRWGVSWLLGLIVALSVTVAATVMPLHHGTAGDESGTPAHVDTPHHDHGHESGHGHEPAHGHGHGHGEPDAAGTANPPRVNSPSGVPVTIRSGADGTVATRTGDSRHAWLTASHEFTLVLIVFAALARLRLLFDKLPGTVWLQQRLPAGLFFPAVSTARSAAIALLAGRPPALIAPTLAQPALRARAARVNRWVRGWAGTDPLSGAHAPLRAALALADRLSPAETQTFRQESRRSPAGVPASEPGWIRPLDGMLAACALARLGETDCVDRWRETFDQQFALRHGRRAAALHRRTMLGIGTAPAWEHAATTALAFHLGWLEETDWPHLRPRCLGRAASGATDPDTLRLVAAGLLWAALTADTEANEILRRRTLTGDPVAAALQALADQVLAEATHGVTESAAS